MHKVEETNSKMDGLLKKRMQLETEIKDIKRNQNDSDSRRGTGGYRLRPYSVRYRYRQYELQSCNMSSRAEGNNKKPKEKKEKRAPDNQAIGKRFPKNNVLN